MNHTRNPELVSGRGRNRRGNKSTEGGGNRPAFRQVRSTAILERSDTFHTLPPIVHPPHLVG
eukprot:1130277-Pyramimonas_sp.AAC.1